MSPIRATAKEVQKNFGRFQDEALKQPVLVTNNGRPKTVLISIDDYERMSARDRRVRLTSELSDEEIGEIVRGLEAAAAELPDYEGE